MQDTQSIQTTRTSLIRILPMYLAAYAVLLCGLGAYISTYEQESFGTAGIAVALVGMGVSLFCRWTGMRQITMLGILAGTVVVVLAWASVTGGFSVGDYLVRMASGRNSGPGLLLAWFLVLYAFAMVSDEVIIFVVVPSIALIGVMASDNLNPEIVVYFLGLVVSAVFLLVYENMLSRGMLDGPAQEQADREIADGFREVPGGTALAHHSVEPAVRVSLFLTTAVAALALVVGLAASVPLSYLGQAMSERTPQFSLPAANEFATAVTNRYINQLLLDGAPPNLSDRVVMQVHATEPHYWRGKVFYHYTGYGWSPEGSAQQLFPEGPREPYRDFNVDRPRRPTERLFKLANQLGQDESKARRSVYQVVQMFDPPVAGMLVSAAEPEAYWIRRRGLLQYDGRSIGVHSSRPGIVYKVKSLVSAATPEQLRQAGTRYPVALRSLNTQLEDNPEDAPRSRRELALRITAPYDNPYDKVKALETHLRDNYLYSLLPPRTPRSRDAVDFFLTESKQGYCEIFASSMAVLAREIGIPARLATGFAPGEWQENRGRTLGTATIREKDLHAWTEIFFPGYGWIPFDPTSSRQAQSSWTASFQSMVRSVVENVSRYRTGPTLILMAMLAIAAFLVKAYVVDPLRASLWWRGLLARHHWRLSPDQRWDLLYARSHRRLRRWAGGKAAHQTPYEYAGQARAETPSQAIRIFDRITELYVDRSFRRGGPEAGDIEMILRLDEDLRKALRHPARSSAQASAPATA